MNLFCYFDRRITVMRFGSDFACRCRALLIKLQRACHHLLILLISTLGYSMCCRLLHSKTCYLCFCLHIHTMIALSNENGTLRAKHNKSLFVFQWQKKISKLTSIRGRLDLRTPGMYCLLCECSEVHVQMTAITMGTRNREKFKRVLKKILYNYSLYTLEEYFSQLWIGDYTTKFEYSGIMI